MKITAVSCCSARTYGAVSAIYSARESMRCRSDSVVVPLVEDGLMVGRDSKDNWGRSKERSTIGGRRAAMRVVMDRLNGMVVVYEQDATAVEGGPRILVFESPSGLIRLDAYPEHWRRMDDEALLALRYPHS